jgi:hypothetical protein
LQGRKISEIARNPLPRSGAEWLQRDLVCSRRWISSPFDDPVDDEHALKRGRLSASALQVEAQTAKEEQSPRVVVTEASATFPKTMSSAPAAGAVRVELEGVGGGLKPPGVASEPVTFPKSASSAPAAVLET